MGSRGGAKGRRMIESYAILRERRFILGSLIHCDSYWFGNDIHQG